MVSLNRICYDSCRRDANDERKCHRPRIINNDVRKSRRVSDDSFVNEADVMIMMIWK